MGAKRYVTLYVSTQGRDMWIPHLKYGHRTKNRNPYTNAELVDIHFNYGADNGKERVAVRLFNGPYGRQGCVLARTVESNQGGRFDGNESVEDSF
ncbi:hypothetical protein TNCV_2015111 [Trichonephila clavipes]|nr:hypothetical protein TNCV_2015111 [Trichonephila clavipes]